MNTTRTAAFFAHVVFASTNRSKKVCQCSVPRRAYSARHCCALNEDGAQRAASKSRINSSCEISSPDIARGDQRSSSSFSIGWSAFRISLPLIICGYTIADDVFCDQDCRCSLLALLNFSLNSGIRNQPKKSGED